MQHKAGAEENNEAEDLILFTKSGRRSIRRWLGARAAERALLLELPVLLESMILLVDSGLGLLPALQRVAQADDARNPAKALFRLLHRLTSRGMPLHEALEYVAERTEHRLLKHVFLHLDISGNEGGALTPSLQSLANHAHLEWRLAVETRVRRLENLVVFPVFGSVIGLLLITVAVPLIPLSELKERLEQQSIEGEVTRIGDVQ